MQEYHIKGNGGIGMLSAEEMIRDFALSHPNVKAKDVVIMLMKLYRNQGIQQASEVCCETLTDGFRISNIQAVLALKEEV